MPYLEFPDFSNNATRGVLHQMEGEGLLVLQVNSTSLVELVVSKKAHSQWASDVDKKGLFHFSLILQSVMQLHLTSYIYI